MFYRLFVMYSEDDHIAPTHAANTMINPIM
jgi:hypothetical protein